MIEGQAMGNPRAAVVADENHRREAVGADHLRDVVRHAALVVAGGRPVGIAVAAQIGRDHGEALGERRHHLAPHMTALRISVQEDHARSLPHAAIVDAHSVANPDDALDHGESLPHGARLWPDARLEGASPVPHVARWSDGGGRLLGRTAYLWYAKSKDPPKEAGHETAHGSCTRVDPDRAGHDGLGRLAGEHSG